MKLISKGIFLNILVLSVLILSGISIAPKTTNSILGPLEICAADSVTPTDTGLTCVRKSADCPDGFQTIIEALNSSSFVLNGNNMSSGSFQNDLVKQYGTDDLYNTCINKSYNKTITIFTSAVDPTQAGVEKSYDLDVLTQGGRDVPRVCEPNYFPDAADISTGAGKPNPGWGCCPANYNYVTAFNITDVNETQKNPLGYGSDVRNAGCCPAVNGLEANYWSPLGTNGVHCMADAQYKVPVTGGGAEYGNDTQNFSMYGKPLGKKNVSSGSPYLQGPVSIDPNRFVCPEGSACVADPANDFYGSSVDSSGNQKGIAACSATSLSSSDNSNTSKVKCYADGEFIGTIDNAGQKLVRKCSSTSAKFYVDVAACNNSLSDELACRGSGASDTNYKLCCNCRIAGGVWTGIGCTDTSPLGIITGIIRITFGVVGGIALLQIIIAGIMYQTGDEARIKAARESIIKTLTGLAVLVFSILILRIIGINILDVLPVGSV